MNSPVETLAPRHQASQIQHVVAAVITNETGEILLSLRPSHVHQAGLWEFPGGKVESGEDARRALERELAEELGIVPVKARPMIRIRHDYPDKSVLLDVWYVDTFKGLPQGREGQQIDWVPREALTQKKFPAANSPIVNAVRLPPYYLITPEPGDDIARFFTTLEHVLKAGIRLVQLRATTCSTTRYKELAWQAMDLCRCYSAQLILNCSPEIAEGVDADGIHLNSTRLMDMRSRPVADDKWLSASCHNRRELEQAMSLGVDFVVISPVLATASHPQASPLDWQGFEELCEHATMPAYALGGMSPQHMETAWRHGAQGIAAITGLWNLSETEPGFPLPGDRPETRGKNN